MQFKQSGIDDIFPVSVELGIGTGKIHLQLFNELQERITTVMQFRGRF